MADVGGNVRGGAIEPGRVGSGVTAGTRAAGMRIESVVIGSACAAAASALARMLEVGTEGVMILTRAGGRQLARVRTSSVGRVGGLVAASFAAPSAITLAARATRALVPSTFSINGHTNGR